jgi:LysM repeat protein
MAALAAVFAIVSSTVGTEEAEEPRATTTQERGEGSGRGETSPARPTRTGEGEGDGTSTTPRGGRRTYTVQPGDTLASIAEETGVSVEELQELNPGIDSNSLSIGQELRLAR